MTTVVWDKKKLASDSQMTKYGCEISQDAMDKVFVVNGTYKGATLKAVGCAGSAVMVKPFVEWLSAGADEEQWIEEFGAIEAIIVTDGPVYHFVGSKFPLEIKGNVAIGSGGSFAESAMSLNHDAISALKHAIKHDVYSSGAIQHVDCMADSPIVTVDSTAVSMESCDLPSRKW